MAAPPGPPAATAQAPRLFPVGFEVLVTAVMTSERQALQDLAREHGIQLLSVVGKAPPHLVVTRSVKSPKYRGVLRMDPTVPVVTPDWLLASVRQGKRLAYDAYRVGPFTGLTICFSGISAAKKSALAAEVGRVGGAHSAALDKKCTHLVTVSTQSDKYKFAKREKIICVQPKWIEDCLSRGWCQDETQYLVTDQAEGMGQSRTDLMPLRHGASGFGTDETTMQSMPAPSGAHGGISESRAVEPASTMAGGSRGEDVQQAPPQRPLASGWQPDGVAAATAAPGAAAGGDRAPPLIQLSPFDAPAKAPSSSANDLEWDDDSPMYLDSCRIHLAGCTPEEQLEMLRAVREGAAKRFGDLVQGLTHIVVGSDLTAVEASELIEYAASNRQAAFVSLEWLRRCRACRERLPADDRFLIPASTLAGYKKKAGAMEGRSMQRTTSQGSLGEDTLMRQPSAVVTGPLAGCYFTLAALRTFGEGREEARVKELIQHNGGRVFNAQTLSIVTDKSKAFAICPLSLLPSDVAHLRTNNPDFKMVDERQRFTPYWLECSLIAGRPAQPMRGAPLYQPLPYPLPLVGMDKVLACISGYDIPVKETIQRTVQVMGGAVTDSMTRRNTHLILPAATGVKYNHTTPFGIKPVTGDWLLDSIAFGRLQPEASYHPPPPVSALSGGQGGAEGTQSRGASEGGTRSTGGAGCGPASQIGATQFPRDAGAAPTRPLPTSLYQAALAGDSSLAAPEGPLAAGAAAMARERSTQQALPPGGRQRTSLREKMTQGRTAAGVGVATHPGRQSNDENAPAMPNLMDADLPVPPWGSGSSLWGQQQQGGGAQPLALDDVLASLGGAMPTRQATPQQRHHEQARAPQPQQGGYSHDQIFGSSSPLSEPALPPPPQEQPQQQGSKPTPVAAGSMPAASLAAAAPSPASGGASNGSGRKSGGGKASASRRGSRGGSSRLRPDPSALTAAMAIAAAEAALGQAGAMELAAPDAEGDAGEAAEEMQAQEGSGSGEDIHSMVDKIGVLLAQAAGPDAGGLGSQQDMPPPPPRGRGMKRAAGSEAESTLSNGGSDGGGAGRQTRAQAKRKVASGSAAKAEHLEVEMSQQVGYDASPTVLPARSTRATSSAQNAAAKERLLQMARPRVGGSSKQADILKEMGL